MTSPRYRGRFAPSPTGPLHFGSLVAALGSWLDARHHDGEWLLRIEDIDPPRERAGASMQQIETLQALGLRADQPVLFQSEQAQRFDAALAQLQALGSLFECRCTRSDLQNQNGIHRRCVDAPSGRRPALRFRAASERVGFNDRLQGAFEQDVSGEVGDVVLRRSDGLYAYQLAVVVDDAAQGITDVVRGADLLDSTARQISLQRALQLTTPRYLHLPLVLDVDGGKLSKSLAAAPIDADAPIDALERAWRFLLPALPAPSASSVERWLSIAAENYRPSELRRHNALLSGQAGKTRR